MKIEKGMKFGKLLVLSKDEEKNKILREERRKGLRSSSPVYWICKCECGNTTSVPAQKLKENKIKSCGCEKIKYNLADYVGKHIESWTILKVVDDSHFMCKCDCGTISNVRAYNIFEGKSTNCGCKRKLMLREKHEKDITGMKFGKLTILKKIGLNEHGKNVYECKCDCGTIKNIVGSMVSGGYTYSCGCVHSKNNKILSDVLVEQNIPHKQEYFVKVDDNNYFRFDVFLETLNAAIEYDGEQHFKPVDFAGKGEEYAKEQLKITQQRDEIKNKYCKDNDITLLRIPYWEKDNIEKLVIQFINELKSR